MKKITLLILSIFLVACGQTTQDNNSANTNEQMGKDLEIQKRGEENSQSKETDGSDTNKVLTIAKGEVLVVDDYAEITVNNTVFGKRIDPPNPGSFYSYYEVKEDAEIYLDTVITVKSLLTSAKAADEFVSVKAVYDDKYDYRTFSTIEEKGGTNFTYTNITSIEPLKSGVLHFIASLPEEVENDGKPLKIIVTVKSEDYELIIR